MLKKIAVAAALLVVVLTLVIASRPSSYRVTRSAALAAPPAAAYAQVADFHRWEAWSPWARLDPGMQTAYSGTDGAVGASYSWKGNDKVGEGRMTIVEARPPESLVIRLEFLKPWAAINSTRFDFAPLASGTQITWSMDGHNDFMGKAFSLVSDLDTMIGTDFQRGLASLKMIVESQAQATTGAVPAVAR
jgi:hypothetical protein